MPTFRTEDLAHGDVTTWHYDEATGLLVFKEYADGKGPTYDYTPDGQLARRTWARGVATDYAYDGQGRLVSKTYSDATPDVSLAYDRLGHTLSAVCDGVSTNFYAYNRFGQLTNEVQNGTTIARSYDALGRDTGYVIGDGIAAGSAVSYAYDTLGRFASVSSGTNVFAYSYLPGSDLVSGMTANTGHAWERIYEPDRDLIATVNNRYGNRTISRFDYTNDEIGRHVVRVDSGEAVSETTVDSYTYNVRSELISAQRYLGTDITNQVHPVMDRSFGYDYDSIGNRVTSQEIVKDHSFVSVYEANELNHYDTVSTTNSIIMFEYDDDGNTIFDGRFRYSWNGENQICSVEGFDSSIGRMRCICRYMYDWQYRTIVKMVFSSIDMSYRRLWVDYNIVQECVNTNPIYYVWGLDIDGHLQGSGGVGGLLLVENNEDSYGAFFDANGNVTDYISIYGVDSAHFEYSPYGEPLVSRGKWFSHRFSTKPYCSVTGIIEYQLRGYSFTLGRWLSRDPLEESSAPNLYVFLNNNAISDSDYLGLWSLFRKPCCNQEKYDTSKYCCCKDGKDTPDATEATLVPKEEIYTGVSYFCRRSRWYHIPIYRPWALGQFFLQHCWLSLDGGAIRAGAYPIREKIRTVLCLNKRSTIIRRQTVSGRLKQRLNCRLVNTTLTRFVDA